MTQPQVRTNGASSAHGLAQLGSFHGAYDDHRTQICPRRVQLSVHGGVATTQGVPLAHGFSVTSSLRRLELAIGRWRRGQQGVPGEPGSLGDPGLPGPRKMPRWVPRPATLILLSRRSGVQLPPGAPNVFQTGRRVRNASGPTPVETNTDANPLRNRGDHHPEPAPHGPGIWPLRDRPPAGLSGLIRGCQPDTSTGVAVGRHPASRGVGIGRPRVCPHLPAVDYANKKQVLGLDAGR